jgi:hypothetical protein
MRPHVGHSVRRYILLRFASQFETISFDYCRNKNHNTTAMCVAAASRAADARQRGKMEYEEEQF